MFGFSSSKKKDEGVDASSQDEKKSPDETIAPDKGGVSPEVMTTSAASDSASEKSAEAGDVNLSDSTDASSDAAADGSTFPNVSDEDIKQLDQAPESIPSTLRELIPEPVARKYQMAIFSRLDDGALEVAMVNPDDIEALNVLRFLSEKQDSKVTIYRASQEVFEQILSLYKDSKTMVGDAVLSLSGADGQTKKSDDNGEADGAGATDAGVDELQITKTTNPDGTTLEDVSVSRLVQVIVEHALDGRASDIHIEPIEKSYRVRFRVDGSLHASLVLPQDIGRAVVARIKILSNLKIDEKRKPQDGRFRVEHKSRAVDLRVSTFPVVEGEKVVLRVLDTTKGMVGLKQLGLEGRNYDLLTKKIKEPFGMILITGPTGSGKSTTLYGFLNILNQEERNIVTLEDPVEYFLNGINQSQVKPEIGYSFANGLRSILRQDPNVIMVGEIRDGETAELAIHAALTGHLVFSTLHTNTAIGAVPRLIDMGIEPFLLASSLQAVAAQRLVRRICTQCQEKVTFPDKLMEQIRDLLNDIPKSELESYGVKLDEAGNPIIQFFRGKGCEACHQSGYKGRVALMEALEATPRVQEIIIEHHGNEGKILEEAAAQHMLSMRQDGVLKALLGLTTLSEVDRVTEGDAFVDEE